MKRLMLTLVRLKEILLCQNDYDAGRIVGLKKGLVQLYQVGLIYDTRDLETDPSSGIFAELTNELSLKDIGSLYDFNKTFAHINFYQKLFPKVFKKMVLAGRVAFGYTALNAPFFEYQDEWSSEGSIEGLGGPNTLRGYKQSRFLSRAMSFNNLEIRYRFAQCKFLKQHFAFSAVPFVDAGGVWDDLSRVGDFSNYRVSEGLGLRIAWNVNTILRFDYAISKEDNQFFFNLSHAF
jgi:outer membrane protein assembly factor BamA